MKLSFVIPCYNSEKTIVSVVEEIQKIMNEHVDFEYEVILVNDYSKDNTKHVLFELAEADYRMKVISFTKNFGQASALMAGFNYVSGDFVITLDDDGQSPVDDIFKMLEKLQQDDLDVVCGKYVSRETRNMFRKLGGTVNVKMMDWLLEKPKGLYTSVFLVARRNIIDEMIKYEEAYPYLAGLLLRTTQNIGNIETVQRSRKEGQSGYTLKKLLNLWMNGFTAFSIKPLRISSAVGIILSILSILYFILVVILAMIFKIEIMPHLILCSINFIGGLVLLSLGLIGEYVGRTYLCINNKPQYIIREIKNIE